MDCGTMQSLPAEILKTLRSEMKESAHHSAKQAENTAPERQEHGRAQQTNCDTLPCDVRMVCERVLKLVKLGLGWFCQTLLCRGSNGTTGMLRPGLAALDHTICASRHVLPPKALPMASDGNAGKT
jgi:hypothetical protein